MLKIEKRKKKDKKTKSIDILNNFVLEKPMQKVHARLFVKTVIVNEKKLFLIKNKKIPGPKNRKSE